MKSFSLAILLATSQAIAVPATLEAVNGVIPGGPPSKRDLGKERRGYGSCNGDDVFRDLRKYGHAPEASSFCSGYIRSTATLTTTASVPTTVVVTQSTTISTTTTATSTVTGTSTVTCAAQPTTPTTCGLEAFGFGQFLISQALGVDPVDCHERCLADINCKAFQVQSGGAMVCNLFSAPTAGNVQPAPGSGFTFYDRDCPDLLPVQCTSAPHRKRDYTGATPTFLTTVPPSRISTACSCFITESLTTTTLTITQQTTVPTTTTTTITTTDISTEITGETTVSYAIITAPP